MLEQEYRSLQRLMEIAELRQKGIQDTHLLDWNFRVAEDTPYVQMGKASNGFSTNMVWTMPSPKTALKSRRVIWCSSRRGMAMR